MVLLMVMTVGYLPIVLPLLLPGVSVNHAQIARSLVLLMLLPLGGALAVNQNLPDIAAKIKPIFDKTSNLSLIVLMALQTLPLTLGPVGGSPLPPVVAFLCLAPEVRSGWGGES